MGWATKREAEETLNFRRLSQKATIPLALGGVVWYNGKCDSLEPENVNNPQSVSIQTVTSPEVGCGFSILEEKER